MDITLSHPFFGVHKDVNRFCSPLFNHTPFSYFVYEKYYFNGHYLALPQTPNFEFLLYKNRLLFSLKELHRNKSHYIHLSERLPLPESSLHKSKWIANVVLAQDFDIYHRFMLWFHHAEYVEVFSFGLNQAIKNPTETSINHVQLLEKYCVYFKAIAAEHITQLEKSTICFDVAANPVTFTALKLKEKEYFRQFFSAIKLDKYVLQGKNGSCELSPKEFKCLLWLFKNKTLKQISTLMQLSHRTLEDYVTTIRRKLGCSSRYELAEIYSKNRIIQEFSFLIED